MNDDPKEIVKDAYNNISLWYLEWVQNDRSTRERYTEKLINASPPSPHVLDLGCGPGLPVLQMLVNSGASAVGCDISSKQLELARSLCPEAQLIEGDMANLSFEPESFEGITCFYTLFHLPRQEQKPFLSKVLSWLKPGGMLVFNCATFDEEGIHGEFLGYGTFWSGFGVEHNKGMLAEVGFEILQAELLEAGDGRLEEDDPDFGVKFWWVAAVRPKAPVLKEVSGDEI